MQMLKTLPCAPPIPRDEEVGLILLAQAGDQRAMERIVLSNTPFIVQQVSRFRRRLDPEDAVQEGVAGFLRAVQKWAVDGGGDIRTYSAMWIRAFVGTAEMGCAMVRPWKSQRMKSLRVAIYRESKKRQVTVHDLLADDVVMKALCELHSVDFERIAFVQIAMRDMHRIDAEVFFDSEAHFDLVAGEGEDVEDDLISEVDNKRDLASMASALAQLDEMDRRVLELRYFEEWTLRQVAAEFGRSTEWIRLVQLRAERKLKVIMQATG